MSWMLIVGTAWVATAAPLSLLIGRSIRLADRSPEAGSFVPDHVPDHWVRSATESR